MRNMPGPFVIGLMNQYSEILNQYRIANSFEQQDRLIELYKKSFFPQIIPEETLITLLCKTVDQKGSHFYAEFTGCNYYYVIYRNPIFLLSWFFSPWIIDAGILTPQFNEPNSIVLEIEMPKLEEITLSFISEVKQFLAQELNVSPDRIDFRFKIKTTQVTEHAQLLRT